VLAAKYVTRYALSVTGFDDRIMGQGLSFAESTTYVDLEVCGEWPVHTPMCSFELCVVACPYCGPLL